MAKKPAAKTPAKTAAPARKGAAKKVVVKKKAAAKKKPTRPAPAAAAQGAPEADLFALVIGCNLYLPNGTPEGSYPSLRGCVSDAERVEAFLRAQAGLTDDRLIRLTSTPDATGKRPVEPPEHLPTYENIIGAFRTLARRARAGDHVYVHFSGHGGRCPTIVPAVKGPTGLDETLVPIDIGNKSSRYVRDVEIAKLLKEMTDKGLVVTAVFDSCHSGGAVRSVIPQDDPVGVRGVDFVDKTKRPTDSLVGTVAELAAATPPEDPTRGPGQTRGVAPADAAATGCVVLAACRPFELAREFTFDGGPSQGALTYWFLKSAGDGAGLSFRTVYDQITARIHDQFPSQTPMLFGNPDRAILGGAALPVVPSVPVTGADGSSVALGAGQAALVQVGAEYAVYPAAARDLTDPAGRVAVVKVTAVRPTTSAAAVTSVLRPPGARAGDRAVPFAAPQRLVRKVDVLRPDGKPAAPGDSALRRVVSALSGQTWVEPRSRPDEVADFVVTTDKRGEFYRICDASTVPLQVRPELETRSPSAAAAVVQRLVHLARFNAVQTLENPDPASALRGRVVVELLRAPAGFQRGDPTAGLTPYPTGAVPRLRPGEWAVLSVTNRSTRPINVVVLDLSSDWSVTVAHPDDRFLTVNAGEAPFHLPLQAGLPAGHPEGADTLKVISTVDPPPGFELLTLPALDRPIPRAAERTGVTRSSTPSPLGALLAAVAADRPTRDMSTGGQAIAAWTVNQVKVEVG